MICARNEEEKEMTGIQDVKIDIKESLVKSFEEVEDIRNGKLLKHSYKEMMKRVRKNLRED